MKYCILNPIALTLMVYAALTLNARAESSRPSPMDMRPHFMLGVGSSPNDPWITETAAQGCKWDVRYQYICGGVNTASSWKTWNQPQGAFVTIYLNSCAKTNSIPCFDYYQMLQSAPALSRGGEDAANKQNCNNPDTMKAYFDDLKLMFTKCAEHKGPVILHIEPDLWGYFQISKEFAPNDPDKTKVVVKSSGHPDVDKFEDTVAGFGKAIVALRDKYAPNVMLAWHASMWGNPNPVKFADFFKKCGQWDLIFTDPSDRDAAWRVAKNYHKDGAWWTEKDFNSFRDWSGKLHELTGLPLIAWQIPMGNTIMASCDNTEGHFMDNRPEYFLDDYPKNTHIAEWAKVGYIGLLFGGGAGGCTSVHDVRKDGITNPEPISGNKGEKAIYPDDDGGFLRVRGGNYYTKGPYPLKGPAPKQPETAASTPVAPKTPPPPAAKPKLPETTLAEWQAKLIARVNERVKSGSKPQIFLKLFGPGESYGVGGANDAELTILVQGNPMPVKWDKIGPAERAGLAKSMVVDDNPDSLLLASVLLYGMQDPGQAEDYLARASLLNAQAAQTAKAIKASLVMP